MTFDLYAWKGPRDLDAARAEALVADWQASGGEPGTSPFEPSTDVAWFYRELMRDDPAIEVASDALPDTSRAPIWLRTDDPVPARVVAMRLTSGTAHADLEAIGGLAAKYDLALFDARSGRVHQPLAEMAAHASATFWWRGATQAAVAGTGGLVLASVAYAVAIPLISGILILVGGFLFAIAVLTFVHEGRETYRRRGRTGGSPAG